MEGLYYRVSNRCFRDVLTIYFHMKTNVILFHFCSKEDGGCLLESPHYPHYIILAKKKNSVPLNIPVLLIKVCSKS